jgi:hypothetical protein
MGEQNGYPKGISSYTKANKINIDNSEKRAPSIHITALNNYKKVFDKVIRTQFLGRLEEKDISMHSVK